MPLETFTGSSVPRLLARAQAELGTDAVIVQVDRSRLPGGRTGFQLTAADPVTAEDLNNRRTSAPLTFVAATQVSPSREDGRLIAVVGPTGAGKTTTVCKLATHLDGFGNKRVGVLCLDTRRTGAITQLRTVAKIRKLRLAIAYEPRDLRPALRRLRRQEVILVDTPGRCIHDAAWLDMVGPMLRQVQPSEVHLVVPTGLRKENIEQLVTAYRSVGISHVLPTKLDEYPGDTSAIEVAAEAALQVRWCTSGRRIPQDLELAADLPAMASNRAVIATQLGASAA